MSERQTKSAAITRFASLISRSYGPAAKDNDANLSNTKPVSQRKVSTQYPIAPRPAEEKPSGAQPSSVTSYSADGPINALAFEPDEHLMAIAGRGILKILDTQTDPVTDTRPLRSTIRSSMNLSSNDVQWGNGPSQNLLATAASNGTIVIWNTLDSSNCIHRLISEHSRAVHRLDFNKKNGNWLLSGSQDGSKKLWDLRERNTTARVTMAGKSEAVRDVKFNPSNPVEFAAAYENGTIQRWDLRNPTVYQKKLNAHTGLALTIAWDSEGRQVASGGRDKTIKVWDFDSDGRRPKYMFQTMAPVSKVAWRPECSQIASCSLVYDFLIRVWDTERPYVSKYVLEEHDNIVNGLFWQDTDTLWSCGKDRKLIRNSVSRAKRPVDFLSHSGFGWSPQSTLSFSLDKPKKSLAEEDSPVTSNQDNSSAPQTRQNSQVSLARQYSATNAIPTKLREPRHTSGILRLDENGDAVFQYFAQNYQITGKSPEDICKHNAHVAAGLGKQRTAKTWQTVALLLSWDRQYQRRFGSKEKGSDHSSESVSTLIPQNDTPTQNTQNNPDLETDVKALDNRIKDVVSYPEYGDRIMLDSASGIQDWRPWKASRLIPELCDYYTDKGDVQLAATLITIVGAECSALPTSRIVDICSSYIDLLRRHQFFLTATEFIKANTTSEVRALNETEVELQFGCHRCFKPLVNERSKGTESHGYWFCERCCRLLGGCIICQMPMRGRCIWCQRCGHAGHPRCLQEWLLHESSGICPALDCGHECIQHKEF